MQESDGWITKRKKNTFQSNKKKKACEIKKKKKDTTLGKWNNKN